jgi:predicted RND superfamily exporter protein
MSVKKKVVEESISRIEKRLSEIDKILEVKPVSRIIEIYEEFGKLLEENQGIEKRTDPKFMNKVEALHREEKEMKALANIPFSEKEKLMNEKIELESERGDLINELWLINRKENR